MLHKWLRFFQPAVTGVLIGTFAVITFTILMGFVERAWQADRFRTERDACHKEYERLIGRLPTGEVVVAR